MSKQHHQYKHQRRHQQKHSKSTSDYDGQNQQDQQRNQLTTNLLSLKLRKPNHWNWELSTSKSCSNIALPRILLYDHTGTLLLDADKCSEQTYRPISDQGCRRKRAATVNLEQSLQQAQLSGKFDGLSIGERMSNTSTFRNQQLVGSCIEFSTHELPDWQPHGSGSSRRLSLLRGVRFDIQDQPLIPAEQIHQGTGTHVSVYPTPPSTSTLTTTANSSSSGPAEKRRYRRSHSYGQRSILERLSMSRGRHSSPEYVQEQAVDKRQRYYLRSSKAGTLVIKDESISRVRQRHRRPRHSSSENVLVQRDRSPANSVMQVSAHKRHPQLLRCRGSLLLSSDEEAQAPGERQSTRQSRCRSSKRAYAKDMPWMCQGCDSGNVASPELIAVDPNNCVY